MTRKTGIAALMLLGAMPLTALAASDMQQPASGAAAAAPAAPAADPAMAKAEPPLFKQLDTNHDGYISREEAKRSATVSAKFDQLDANHDGRISVDEYVKGVKG